MAHEMTYAKALNEAKQVIIQQQLRIKADAEKIKVQQQTILDQSNALSEGEHHVKDQAAELQRLVEELSATHSRLNEATTAREQAEAVVDRQGERITLMQAVLSDMEKRLDEQATELARLTSEADALRAQLPTGEDVEALHSMSDLLSRRPASKTTPVPGAFSNSSLRLSGESSEAPNSYTSAEAA